MPQLARAATLALTLAATFFSGPRRSMAEDLGVRVIDGFTVTQFAGDDLAHDIHSMTIDAKGRVVVSGVGYVRILEDKDGDGKADFAKEFASGPSTGAQGMVFYGNDLLCVGDGGLIRYRDRDGNDRADGAPDMFLRAKTGGEHDLHAIRRGADGSWYIIAGNMAEITEQYVSLPTSPVTKPRAGTLLRLTPDLRGAEVIAHGLRNAYDFDFNTAGDLFTFDSDGEPEMSLPWYNPTRVYHLTLGADCGWHTKTWKHPEGFLDMPPVVASFGRSSPTGVVCYRHRQFPAPYQGALFTLDWTYGRMWALPLQEDGATWSTKPVEFMTAVGEHGFAPTDLEVGPDGALYVVVGGRGTRGGIYRIVASGQAAPPLPPVASLDANQRIYDVLTAPQPLSSWSRARWEPMAAEIPDTSLLSIVIDERWPVDARVRAVEILTERGTAIPPQFLARLSESTPWQVRARAAWSLGRTAKGRPDATYLNRCLAMTPPQPQVQRAALEAILAAENEHFDSLVPAISNGLASTDCTVRQAASAILTRVPGETYGKIADATVRRGWQATVPLAEGLARRKDKFSPYAAEIGTRILTSDFSPAMRKEAARLLQIALGDLVPEEEGFPEVFQGYASRIDLSENAKEVGALQIMLGQAFPTGIEAVDEELGRVIAMLQPNDPELLGKVLAKITKDSSPIADIHYLIVAARIPSPRNDTHRQQIAQGVLALESKIEQRKLVQDSGWDDRMIELFDTLVELDPPLGTAVVEHPLFGKPGHVQFVGDVPTEVFERAVNAYVKQVEANPEFPLNGDIIFLFAATGLPKPMEIVRSKFDDLSLRPAIIASLSEHPSEADRELFVSAMESAPVDMLTECAKAIALLSPGNAERQRENVMLLRVLRRLGNDGPDREVRDQVAELLRISTGQDFGYKNGLDGQPQTDVIGRWTAYIQEKYSEEYARQSGAPTEDVNHLNTLLAQVPWESGDAARGQKLFTTRACIQCHGTRTALGPDLRGAATRFSKQDLFTAIAFPSRDVSPRYQQTMVVTTEGKTFTGMVVYEAIDAVVLRNAANMTSRVEKKEIEQRRDLSTSIMPNGLLQGLQPTDLADLYAYLRSQSAPEVHAEVPAGETK
ncbi:PVC-type heme-binding CxxCH protein [Planctomyces sp. SH-PL14]|uniref:PVC-type heme-binding CxxCH protein n=1 Tax=Planctomyces sp. SH-PL14 TaxID=1632864 RepID=UPI00078E9F30|nr:PVC-type heme-binding CxxCH protein [Planctomyces sp. SH-PL14]AMV21950.1 Cytochrome c [Planctomyces sp. SH-PL14]